MVALSFGHKTYFTFQFKGPLMIMKDQIYQKLACMHDMTLMLKINQISLSLTTFNQSYDSVQEVNLQNVACGYE